MQELQKQQAAYRGLLQRNREQPLHLMQASQHVAKPTALPLPFVLIQVSICSCHQPCLPFVPALLSGTLCQRGGFVAME